jgi:hypothetical protein
MCGGHQNRKNNYTLSGPAFTRQYFMTAVTGNDYVHVLCSSGGSDFPLNKLYVHVCVIMLGQKKIFKYIFNYIDRNHNEIG